MSRRASGSKKPAGRRVFQVALVVIPLGILGNIAFSLWKTDTEVLASLSQFPRQYLFLAALLALVPWATNTLRLWIWTRLLRQGLSLRQNFQIALGMDLGSAVSPTGVGGSAAKWGMLVGRGVSPGTAVSITWVGVLEDAIFFALAVPLALYFSSARRELSGTLDIWDSLQGYAQPTLLALAGSGFLGLAVVRLGLRGRFGRRLRYRGLRLTGRLRAKFRVVVRDAKSALRLIAHRGKSRFVLTLGLTGIQWICRYSVLSALLVFLGAPFDPLLYFALQWVVFTMMTFVPTPGASGGAEAAFYVLYAPLLPERIIGVTTAGWRLLTFYLQIGLAAAVFLLMQLRQREPSP